jgi:hypothetical protein
MANCGIARIDELWAGAAEPIRRGDPDSAAVGVIQDFLIGHGFKDLPGPLGNGHGSFGPLTARCVQQFRDLNRLGPPDEVDHGTLALLVAVPARNPVAARGYLTMALDCAFDGIVRIMSVTCQFEGAGRFAAINPNHDRAGLSFGIIQWAQKPGRLGELLRAFAGRDRERFVKIFADGDTSIADGLLAHTSRVGGGVTRDGVTLDLRFDLVAPEWIERFRAAALDPVFQRVQVDCAVDAFRRSLARIRSYAPAMRSERALAFMLDLANQHGDGGAESIFHAAAGSAGTGEGAIMLAMEREPVRRVAMQFGPDDANVRATRNRRCAFRTSPLLRDVPGQI